MKNSRILKYILGFYPLNHIHCHRCGNYPFSGLKLFETTTLCCIVTLSDKVESEQSKLISYSKLF